MATTSSSCPTPPTTGNPPGFSKPIPATRPSYGSAATRSGVSWTTRKDARRFTYRLLRETLELNPSNLKTILTEVFNLNEEQQESLVGLLRKTSLAAIIHDEFSLGADDQSLRSVLQEHRQILGLPDIMKQLTKPESEELGDIPDFMPKSL
jgi:hypothetical protein